MLIFVRSVSIIIIIISKPISLKEQAEKEMLFTSRRNKTQERPLTRGKGPENYTLPDTKAQDRPQTGGSRPPGAMDLGTLWKAPRNGLQPGSKGPGGKLGKNTDILHAHQDDQ